MAILTRYFRASVLSAALPCLLLSLSAPSRADEADLDALLDGVSEVVVGGAVPGPVCVYGDDAFVVLPGESGGALLPAVAGARYGAGRAIVVGHEALLLTDAAFPDSLRFLANAVTWAAQAPSPRVALYGFQRLQDPLRDAGIAAEVVDPADALVEHLATVDALVAPAYAFDGEANAERRAALLAFVHSGGGLVTGCCPWGWKYYDPELDIANDLGMNAVLAPMGLVLADGMVGPTGPRGYRRETDLALLHAANALDALVRHADGEELNEAQLRQVTATLSTAVRAIPRGDEQFMPRLRAACATESAAAYPSPDSPVSASDPFARIGATLELEEMRRLAPAEVRPYRGADTFPGSVPTDAPRVARTVTLNTAKSGWHSTGLYAPAGEVITVAIPESAAGKGLRIRIGCHTDTLWHLDRWQRFPEISRSWPASAAETRVASPFGGLVYIEVPGNSDLGVVEANISGAVEAPHYVHGKTNLADWRERIRVNPAPWAELEGRNIVLTMPSDVVRELDDPESVMTFWDYALDCDADLAGMPRERARPERIVADIQISAGYMHSGYPIMTFLDAPPRAVDLKALTTTGSWGHFHELGHNHQSGHWTFDGTVEVTCNLFSLYVHEVACRLAGPGHPAIEPAEAEKRLSAYLAKGAPFEQWKSDPFLALAMYVQLKDAFGWQAFCSVFRGYRTDTPDRLPRTDDEKRDQFMVRFSREVGRNLGPFFQAWGVPTSEEARASIADLPAWLPEALAVR